MIHSKFSNIVIALLCIFFTSYSLAQLPVSDQIQKANQLLKSVFYDYQDHQLIAPIQGNTSDSNIPGGRVQQYIKMKDAVNKLTRKNFQSSANTDSDTLFIGFIPGEEVHITGDWVHSGTIIVFNDGLLSFDHAHATILGDIITAGSGRIIADSSQLFIPQEFFYQRNIIIAENSEVYIKNSTVDFGGLVNNLAVAHNGHLILENVLKPDFSTISLMGQSSISIDGIDMAGEFVCDDESSLEISNAETVLVWHRFPEGSSASLEFPDGKVIKQYIFDTALPNVSGVNYSVHLNNCSKVWWGLMPSNGSDITISNSDMRTIGLWYEGDAVTEVSGLVNGTHYTDHLMSLTDRNLRLINTKVTTWSIYTLDEVNVSLDACIIGEIGAMRNSQIQGLSYYCDGSGGYVWGTDTTFTLSAFSSIASSIRSSGNGIFIFAYSSLINGIVNALDQSVLMLIQSSTPEAPQLDLKSCIWMANIEEPASAPVNTTVPVKGSAWIDKGPLSDLMDFDHFEIYYQSVNDTTVWHQIESEFYHEVRNDVLVNWNTSGLDPGGYNLKLKIYDDLGNPMEAIRQITLLPEILSADALAKDFFNVAIAPNPATSQFNIDLNQKQGRPMSIRLINMLGEEILIITDGYKVPGKYRYTVNSIQYPGGLYFCKIESEGLMLIKKVIIR